MDPSGGLLARRAASEAICTAGGPRTGMLHDPQARLVDSTTTGGPSRWPMRGTLALGTTKLLYRPVVSRYGVTVQRTRIRDATVTRDFLGAQQPQALIQITWTDPQSQEPIAGWVVDDLGRCAVALRTST
jgi:hypothetical protein